MNDYNSVSLKQVGSVKVNYKFIGDLKPMAYGDSPCECNGPGFCQRYQIEQQEYPWQICQSNSDKGKAYRTKWAKDLVRRSQGGPGIVQKAINATKAVAKTAVNMFRMTPKEIQEERAAICDVCEFNDKTKGICIHPRCGCNLKRGLVGGLIPSKLEIASERCPLGKWNSV